MVSMSLFIELLRTRPRTLFWTMAVLQGALWTLVPALFYAAPPGQLPLVLAIGHEFHVGTEFGPPLAFWVAEIGWPASPGSISCRSFASCWGFGRCSRSVAPWSARRRRRWR
jgi:hypothetical protein